MSGRNRPIDWIARQGFVDEIDARADREIDTADDAIDHAHRFLPSLTPRERRERCPAVDDEASEPCLLTCHRSKTAPTDRYDHVPLCFVVRQAVEEQLE